MRNLLLGTSALIVAGSMLAGPAMAQNKPISLSLGGYFTYYMGFVSQDDGVGQAASGAKDHGFLSDGEIYFRGSTTLDNGLTVGLQVELETTTVADQIDETYLYFRSQYGEIRVGQDDSYANAVSLGAPGAAPRLSLQDPALVFTAAPAGHRAGAAVDTDGGNFSSDAEKITYMTPRIAGLQVGISYTADSTETGTPRAATVGPLGSTGASGTVGAQEDIWEIGASYNQTFQGVGIALQGGYSHGTLELDGAAGAVAAGFDDRTEWALGGQISYMGFTLGGSYRQDDQGLDGRNELTAWNVGIMYTMGPWAVSAAYGEAEIEAGTGFVGEDETKMYEIAIGYTVGPGIEIGVALIGTEYTNVADQLGAGVLDNDTTTFAIGTRLSF